MERERERDEHLSPECYAFALLRDMPHFSTLVLFDEAFGSQILCLLSSAFGWDDRLCGERAGEKLFAHASYGVQRPLPRLGFGPARSKLNRLRPFQSVGSTNPSTLLRVLRIERRRLIEDIQKRNGLRKLRRSRVWVDHHSARLLAQLIDDEVTGVVRDAHGRSDVAPSLAAQLASLMTFRLRLRVIADIISWRMRQDLELFGDPEPTLSFFTDAAIKRMLFTTA
jgi:hypothetical protein